MKNQSGKSLVLTGLLLATPLAHMTSPIGANAYAETRMDHHSSLQGNLYISGQLTATASEGFSRSVVIGIRIQDNQGREYGNRGVIGKCLPENQADSVAIEILDPETMEVLATAKRFYGNLTEGKNELKNTDSSVCRDARVDLNIIDSNTASLLEVFDNDMTFYFSDNARVTLPNGTIFTKL